MKGAPHTKASPSYYKPPMNPGLQAGKQTQLGSTVSDWLVRERTEKDREHCRVRKLPSGISADLARVGGVLIR